MLEALTVYDTGDVALPEVLAHVKLRSLELIGSLDPKKSGYDLATLWPLLQGLETLIIAPDQGMNYRATFTRGTDGWSVHVKLEKNGRPAWAAALFELLLEKSLCAVTFDPAEPPYDTSRWRV